MDDKELADLMQKIQGTGTVNAMRVAIGLICAAVWETGERRDRIFRDAGIGSIMGEIYATLARMDADAPALRAAREAERATQK